MPEFYITLEARISVIAEDEDEITAQAGAVECVREVLGRESARVRGVDIVCCTEEPTDA